MRNAYFIRMERGETLGTVSDATGVAVGSIRALEDGSREPNSSTVARLCTYYEVGARVLLASEPVEPTEREAA